MCPAKVLDAADKVAVPGAMARFREAVQLQQSAMGLPRTAVAVPPAFFEVSTDIAIAVLVTLLVYRQAIAERDPAAPLAI